MAVENVAPVKAPSGEIAVAGALRTRHAPSLAALAVAALTLVGAGLRVIVAHQSLFADELSTYWISATHGFGGVLSLLYSTGRIQHAEITPPLSFLASWLTTLPAKTVLLLRAPALIAGTATIPLVYVLGLRTIGRRGALLSCAITTLSPFMIYYSAEARAYGLMMFLLACSTLSLLLAIDTRRTRYWVLYAVFAAAAFYTHYTCGFILAVQLGWMLWTEPELRRRTVMATGGAAVLVIPWIPGLIADLRSPTVKILSAISAFTPSAVRIDLEHWAVGYPYTIAGGLRQLPGTPALVLLAVAIALAAAGVAVSARRQGGRLLPSGHVDGGNILYGRRFALVALLMVATPIGEILVSATGDHIVGIRDMGASWPFLALTLAGLVVCAGRRVAPVSAALLIVGFALAATKMFDSRFARPDYQSAADYVAAQARPGDVVVDGTGVLTPGPLTGFDVSYHGHLPVFRALARAERDHPFTLLDPVTSIPAAFAQARDAAHGGRIFIVSSLANDSVNRPNPLTPPQLGSGYMRRLQRRYPGFLLTLVTVYSRAPNGPS